MRRWRDSFSFPIVVVVLTIFAMNYCAMAAEPFGAAPKAVESFDVGTLHVDRFGSGAKAMVLIPGLASGAWVWYGTIEKFSPDYAVYVITLPGFDGRVATKERPLFAAFQRDFWAMLDAKKIEKPVVIGHSLGGTLAIALAEEHSEKLTGIVAVDGLPVFPMAAYATADQRKAMAEQMAGMFDSISQADFLAAEKNYMSSIGTSRPDLVDPTAKLEARSDPKMVAAWTREDITSDLRPGLGKITCSFLEIMPYDPNGGSPYTQEQTAAFYQSLIAGTKGAKVVAIVPARHFVMLDEGEKFYEIVEGFLGKKEASH